VHVRSVPRGLALALRGAAVIGRMRRPSALERAVAGTCKVCGHDFDVASAAPGTEADAAPTPGALTFCIECAAVYQFDAEMRHVPVNLDELPIAPEQRAEINELRRAIVALNEERRHRRLTAAGVPAADLAPSPGACVVCGKRADFTGAPQPGWTYLANVLPIASIACSDDCVRVALDRIASTGRADGKHVGRA
jgi:hypothetical protein